MGSMDGYVVGATKLVDHGSSADRWDVVLVGEGFRDVEQSLFATQANEFAQTLFGYIPFRALDVELALNVWRLDVVSSESGVDDPADCGGTGDAPATYFDGARCLGGVERALGVDFDLVMITVGAWVPFWDSVIVVANSPLDGGNTAGSVSAVTTNGDWIATTIHELGHQLGLADEYDTLQGCQYDEPSQYHFSGAEPVQPNVTAKNDLATIKWANLVTPTATVVLNPDCTKCGPATSPLPPKTIGAFEGAHTFHCGAYRPGFTCRMRDEGIEFCPVCSGYLSGFLLTYSGFESWPADLATDVDPWPTTLSWTPGTTESAWEIQITDQPDFTGQVQHLVTTKTQVVNGQALAYESVWLEPGKDYRWRVRKLGVLASAWTQARTFTTEAKKVQLLSPRTFGRSGTKYPWGLKFSWMEVDGADHYEVEVAEASVANWSPLIFPAVEVFGTSKALDVKVKAHLHWRAHAIPTEGAAYAGEWSDPFPFSTSWPQVTIDKPADGDPVYPWPVRLRWYGVKGAAKYKVELQMKKDQWGVESQAKSLEFTPPTTHVDLNMRPRHFSDNETHTWRVRVWGPPPLEDEGQDSGLYKFVNYGDKTIPGLIDCAQNPGSSGPDGIHWMQPDGTTSMAWKKVKNAQSYWLQVMNFGDDTTDPDGVAWADEIDAAVYPGYPTNLLFGGWGPDLIPAPAIGVTGYWWKATAIGPEELPGLDDGTPGRRCYVWPDAPELLQPAQATPDNPGDYGNVLFTFTSPYSPSGKYRLNFTWAPSVGGLDENFPFNPGAVSQFHPADQALLAAVQGYHGIDSSGLKPNKAYQWMLKAHSDIPDAAGGASWAYPWSLMNTYVTKPPAPPPPPPTPDVIVKAWDGSVGVVLGMFVPVASADNYLFECQRVASDNYDNPLEQVHTFPYSKQALESFTQQLITNLTGQPWPSYPLLIAELEQSAPLNAYRWRVSACAGSACSAPSEWGLWGEVFPWPF